MTTSPFLLLGAPQTGCPALGQKLAAHPELSQVRVEKDGYLSPLKGEKLAQCLQGLEGKGGLCDASLFLVPEITEALKEHAPATKVILLLQPPVTWMRAWHHELLARGWENEVDFGQALAREKKESGARSKVPSRLPTPDYLNYQALAHFSKTVQQCRAAVGEGNVFVGLLEEACAPDSDFSEKLSHFLGLKDKGDFAIELQAAPPLVGTHHLDLTLKRVLQRLPGGGALQKAFAPRYRKFADRVFAPMSDLRINSILEEELLEEFEPEVAELGRLLERDLSHWNEPQFPRSENEHHHHHH